MARTDRNNLRTARNLRRSSFTRAVKQSFLIVCEGENTEPDYFNAFRLTSANVRAIGKGDNTLHLINEALIIRENERRRGRNYDQCWVVFDKDDFPNNDFNRVGGKRKFSSYFRFPTSHTTVQAGPHTAVP